VKYKIHRLDIKLDKELPKLEEFLNQLKGEVISIFPNVKPTFQGMGGTAKVDFVVIVEKLR
jgi:hypothetical protein